MPWLRSSANKVQTNMFCCCLIVNYGVFDHPRHLKSRPSSVFFFSAVSYGKKQLRCWWHGCLFLYESTSASWYTLPFFLSITLTKLAWMVWVFAVSSSRTTVRRDVTKTRNGERARGTVKWKMRQPALDVNSVVLTAHLSAPVLTSAWNFVAELPLNRHHF